MNNSFFYIVHFHKLKLLIYFTSTKIWQMSSLKRDQSYVYIPKHS